MSFLTYNGSQTLLYKSTIYNHNKTMKIKISLVLAYTFCLFFKIITVLNLKHIKQIKCIKYIISDLRNIVLQLYTYIIY